MTPATVGDALLQDIIAQPDADDLRLIYADWLEDAGQPEYAEFIHAGVAAGPGTHLRSYQDWDGDPALRRVCAAWDAIPDRAAVFAAPPSVWLYGSTGDPAGFATRGFVSDVLAPCDFWLQHGPRLARTQPLERAKLTDRRPQFYLGRYWWLSPVAARDGPSYACIGKLYQHLPQRESAASTDCDTPEAANAALSTACLAWARSVKCLACNDTGRLAPALGSLADCFCKCEVGQALLEKDPAYQAGRRAARDAERRVREAIQGTKEPHPFQLLWQGTWPHPVDRP